MDLQRVRPGNLDQQAVVQSSAVGRPSGISLPMGPQAAFIRSLNSGQRQAGPPRPPPQRQRAASQSGPARLGSNTDLLPPPAAQDPQAALRLEPRPAVQPGIVRGGGAETTAAQGGWPRDDSIPDTQEHTQATSSKPIPQQPGQYQRFL